ncbi:hypothetical protein KYJ26_00105 [Bacillus sp. MCCB 382]|uniref:hypothetical protein n=1 Tax=Bacillus sp. MCCB 382 TaxID=2860197 RepID=UPI001C58BD0E|nr:hypothetical protein [Bacillus sp. MCCB 382]
MRKMAETTCITMPTNGIQPMQDVTIPSILPVVAPLSLIVRIRVVICKTSIMTSGNHKKPMMMAAPSIGTPKIASKAPVVHFKILEVDIGITSFL